MKFRNYLVLAVVVSALPVLASANPIFNGAADNQIDSLNYFYRITGGLFPTGNTPNGDANSGGTFRYITDDPSWGYTIDTWLKDGWFSDNAGFALTLKNGNAIVYDNNGIETNTYGDYYNQNGSHADHGLYRGYGMSNNYDFVFASYFQLTDPTTITSITGYFDANGAAGTTPPFDPFNVQLAYNTNFWSSSTDPSLPTNTGSFTGDVFSSRTTGGTYSISDTNVVRVFTDNSTDPIYRLTYTLDAPITLGPGVYWFSQDAEIVTPEPATLLLLGSGILSAIAARRRRA